MKTKELIDLLNQEVDRHREELLRIREDLHRIPELAFREFFTTDYIENYLVELPGISSYRVSDTGLVAELTSETFGKRLAIRADIDGLPVTEETGLAFSSEHPGQMHACGHDGHMAALLIAAKILSQHRHLLKGSLRFLFQPAEEVGKGANLFISKGVLQDVDYLFGLHLWTPLATSLVGVNEGALMAAGDFFDIVIKGKGGHGAMPQETIDPIVIGANLITSLQTIVSRNLAPIKTGVVSVTSLHGGNSYNVIPESLTLKGTLRALSLTDMEFLYGKIESLTHDICQAYGGKGVVTFASRPEAYPLINNPYYAKKIKKGLQAGLMEAKSREIEPTLAGDDFSQYSKTGVSSCYVFVGSGGLTKDYPHHHPKFNVSPASIVTAAKTYLHAVRLTNMVESDDERAG
ncbi:amidohydrolase [Vagococcus sp. BWB3-3]|uniref:Amidohydrolase n=1 Tax=Vagococcus allomyrinae TaxID=2794353 RepID=A0A940PA23_9ENTE|nr:amidohydrolase [Vagococcus allomyrinae]MBP1042391.1 amidohydrolase [Vagococcus allomyrinae]